MSPPSKEKRSGGRRPTGKTLPATDSTDEPGVLTSLPSTRPQRPSARRTAARQSAAVRAERAAAKPKRAVQTPPERTAKPRAKPKPPTAPRPPSGAPSRRRASAGAAPRPRSSKPAVPPVPRQGFEAEDAIELGRPVQPPSGSELAASMVELVGELAQTGLSAGGRALRDALTRLAGG